MIWVAFSAKRALFHQARGMCLVHQARVFRGATRPFLSVGYVFGLAKEVGVGMLLLLVRLLLWVAVVALVPPSQPSFHAVSRSTS